MAIFKIAPVFSSNMVLQRNKNVSIFGEGEDGAAVNVTILGETYSAVVKDEKWLVTLPPMTESYDVTVTVSCGDITKTFVNVAIGEVWLAGGQSNMELELQNCKGGKEVLATDKNPDVRYFYTKKIAYMDEQFYKDEADNGWTLFSETTAANWSAVGYFFARKLAKELGVAVGILGCNWGGTSATAWMSRDRLLQDSELRTYVDEYDKAIEGKSVEELNNEYKAYQEYDRQWYLKSLDFYAKYPDGDWDFCQEVCGKNLYPGPMGPMNPFHPEALYNSMLTRVCPYTIKGFLYYQGESDDHKPRMYFKLFSALIQQWRDIWGDDELPFIITQLPMHKYKADPDFKHWCLIREAQERAFRTIKNTALAVIIDCGAFNEIHPKDKVPVGERLCLQALCSFYGKTNLKAFSPMFDYLINRGSELELHFTHAEDGFKGETTGFELAGADKKFVPATVRLNGSVIVISAPEVEKPLYARYLWTNYAEVTLYGANGLPVAPFRSSREDE